MTLPSGPCACYPPRPMSTRLVVALLFALTLAACGKSGTSGPPPAVVKNASRGGFTPSNDESALLDRQTRVHLLKAARAACEGRALDEAAPAGAVDHTKPLWIHLFHEDGRHLAKKRVDGKQSLLEKVAATRALCAKHDPSKVYIHLLPVTYTARFPNFGIVGIFDYRVFEPQVMGLAYELEGKRVERDPVDQVRYNTNAKGLRSLLSKKVGLDPKEAPADNRLLLEMYRVQHFAERYPDRSFGDFYRGFEVVGPQDVSTAVLRDRLGLIAEWYRHNVRDDGQITYKYHHIKRQELEGERTMVRSTMATWIMNRLAFFLADDDLAQLAMKPVRYYFERYFNMEDSLEAGAIQASTTPLPNGNLVRNRFTVASFIASALLERPDWKDFEREIDLLMAYAMSFRRDDGVVWTPFGQSQFFMPGQLMLAVAYAYEKTKDEKYKAFFDSVFDTYAPLLYQMMELGPASYSPYAPAWYTQPAARMFHVTGEPKYRDLVFAINDRVQLFYEINAKHQVHPDWDGILTPKPLGFGNNSITAASLEALADAAIVAKKVGDKRRLATYLPVVRHTVAYLLRLQYTPANTYFLKGRERVVGGFKTDLLDGKVWMDNVWHLTSAFIKIHQAGLLD